MLNKITTAISFLVALGTKAIAAVEQHRTTLNLSHSEEEDLPGKMMALTTSNTVHKEALLVMRNKRRAIEAAVKTARRFMMVLRESLKPTLGTNYSVQWTAVGFNRNLSVPRSADRLLGALQLAESYLIAHPIAEGGPTLAAARAALLHTALATAVAEIAQQKETLDRALTTRNQHSKALEQGLRTLLSELHQVLDPMDARWLAFGFLKPGQRKTPDRPGKVSTLLIGSSAVALKWKKTARAAYYRVWKKVIGVDEDYVPVGSPADLDFTLENLPVGAQVEIVISAVNNGGESAFSEAVVIEMV